MNLPWIIVAKRHVDGRGWLSEIFHKKRCRIARCHCGKAIAAPISRKNTMTGIASKRPRAHLSGHHQGALDLRAGSPADERRTRSRSLRGTILARPSPSCAYDDDRLRLSFSIAASQQQGGKKESTGHRRSRLCQPCATPSSNSSLNYRRSDARIAENGFATSRGVSKSAKVVLVSIKRSHAGLIG